MTTVMLWEMRGHGQRTGIMTTGRMMLTGTAVLDGKRPGWSAHLFRTEDEMRAEAVRMTDSLNRNAPVLAGPVSVEVPIRYIDRIAIEQRVPVELSRMLDAVLDGLVDDTPV